MSNPMGYLSDARGRKPPTPKLKFDDDVIFQQRVNDYFDSITLRTPIMETIPDPDDPENTITQPTGKYDIKWISPPTMVALGVYLDCDYRLFQDYESEKYINHPQMTVDKSKNLSHTIFRARQICHSYTLGSVYTAKSANGPIFVLKTVYKDHGYQEEININQQVTSGSSEINLDNLDDAQLEALQNILSKAVEDKQHQITKQIAQDADFEDVDLADLDGFLDT